MKKYNHFIFVVDESGSIGNRGLCGPMTKHLHQTVKAAEDACHKAGQGFTATLVTFGYPTNTPTIQSLLGSSTPLLNFNVRSSGGTPLFDAVAVAINSVATKERLLTPQDDESFVVQIITDGDESHSTNFTAYSLKRFIDKKIGTDRWSFAWQVPTGYKRYLTNFGFDSGSIIEWSTDAKGADEVARNTAVATQSYVDSRTAGARSTRTYYQPDAANLQKTEVKNNLQKLSHLKAWTVDSECSITEFVEQNGQPFVAGAGYFALTKKEKVQDYKSLILNPRGTNEYYVGKEDARDLLGIPHGECYVEPGNHGDWIIYVQSTSNNRKLVRGTKLVYRTDVAPGAVPQTWDWQKAHKEAQEKQEAIALDTSKPLAARVFGAIFAGKNHRGTIHALCNFQSPNVIDGVLKKLKADGLIEYQGQGKDKGWKPVKGAKPPVT